MISHWAVCIQGVCYELGVGDKKKGEPPFLYRPIPEQEWRYSRQVMNGEQPEYVGEMTMPYTPEDIHKVGE